MLGYDDNITDGGILQAEHFSDAIIIKDKEFQGNGYTFVQTDVHNLNEMPEWSTLSHWRVSVPIISGVTYWAVHTSDEDCRYLKMRVAYIEGNEVGVEYKVADTVIRPQISDIEQTIEGSSTFIFSPSEAELYLKNTFSPIVRKNDVLSGNNYIFALCDNVAKLSDMPDINGNLVWDDSVSIEEGQIYWGSYVLPTSCTYFRLRIAFVDGDRVGIEYKLDITQEIQNVNANDPIEGKSFVTDYSMPHLNPDNYYVEHIASYGNEEYLNFAYEWVENKKHTAWVAFSFDEITSQKNVSRSDAWAEDPLLPTGWCPEESNHKSDGFDKGHLCASEDRVYSKEANEQTFYYSNMSPQMSSFNGGFWASFEILVQKWARSGGYTKLYVTKGGTVDQLLVNFTGTRKGNDGVLPQTDANGFTKKGLACPKYYYMAILAEKGNEYHAIGFWMEHRDDYGYEYDNFAPSDVMKTYALSIDDLEKNTGLDFFCNLPDDVENSVESTWNEADWAW
ncbi:dNA/RNA non-specific endonuclease [Bacteroides sp. CAG:661]|nr:dNA/RNA non-specific endonuclease [Bacteroides sp. CAG:661]